MEMILENLLEAVISVAVVYVVYLIRKKWSPSAIGTLKAIVPLAVSAVEQIAKRSKLKGAGKLDEALGMVEDAFETEMKRPIDIKESEVAKYMIEAAVKELFPKVKK